MKLLTLNCHSWQEENQLDKIKHLAETIQEKSYDVITLQEVSQSIASPVVSGYLKEDNFALVLLEELQKLGVTDYEIIWDFAHIGYDIYEEGLAILTKHPIIKDESFFISKNEDTNYWKTRKIVGAQIEYNGKPVSFYSCHLGWWEDEEEPFQHQMDSLLQQTKQEALTFWMGDFNNNALIRGEGYDYILKQGLYDTYHLAEKADSGVTVKGKIAGWDQNKQDLRIDLILTNQSIPVLSSNVIFNGTNKTVISDHFGVEIHVKQ
ncbi:maltose 6'-phosphate phosphatase [Bacillus fengqiuensis]|nr:maltose 6'-phosphate phosphatase [Bacillus fengqiuensis]